MQIRISDGNNSVIGICELFNRDKGLSDSCTLDFSGVSFLGVGVIAALAMYARCMLRTRRTTISSLQSTSCHQYLQRINFFNSLGIELKEDFYRHDATGSFLEITEIIDDDEYTANAIPAKLRTIIERASYVDVSLVSAIDQSFGEIIDNVLNHSWTTVPGIAIAQHYPKLGYVEFCVADAGIGIVQSLMKNPELQNRSPSSLMKSAFQYGIGENIQGIRGSNDGYGCGYGLAFAAKLVEAGGGELWAISHENCITLTRHETIVNQGCWFPGTLICARIPDRTTLTEKDLDVKGLGLEDRPYYWDASGNELEDLFNEDDILW